MALTEAQVTLANVLADALAHHENGECDSVVMVEADGPYLSWLDWERAGRIAAHALVEVVAPAGWTGPTPLFTVRADGSSPPSADAAVAAPDGMQTSSGAAVRPAVPTPPAAGPGEYNLVGRMLGLARKVMPIDVMRQRFLSNQMRALGLDAPTLGSLHQLNDDQLLTIIDRLEAYGEATHRLGVTPGVPG